MIFDLLQYDFKKVSYFETSSMNFFNRDSSFSSNIYSLTSISSNKITKLPKYFYVAIHHMPFHSMKQSFYPSQKKKKKKKKKLVLISKISKSLLTPFPFWKKMDVTS